MAIANAISALSRSSLPQRRADQLVALLGHRRRRCGQRLLDGARLVVADLAGADGDVVGVAAPGRRLHDRVGEAGVGDRRARLLHPDLLAGRELQQPAAGELHAEVQAAHDDAGDRDARRRRRRRRATRRRAASAKGPLSTSQVRSRARAAEAGRPRRRRTERRAAQSVSTRATTSAETIEATTPMDSVTPNPLTGPEAKKNSSPAASSVVTLESRIADQALR